jgi:hypothetical protein
MNGMGLGEDAARCLLEGMDVVMPLAEFQSLVTQR